MALLNRLLVVLAVLVSATLASRTAHAAAALVQAPTGATGTTSVTAKWSSATGSATGELLVAILTYNNAPTVGIPMGSSWQLAGSVAANGTNVSTAIYYWQNPPSGRTAEVFTFTGSSASSVQLAEFTGMQSSGVLDVTGTATVNDSSITAATSSPTTTGPELAVLGFASDNNGMGRKWDSSSSPFGNLGGTVSTGSLHSRYSYQLNVASNTSVSETLTEGNKAANLATVAATFKVLVTPLYWRGGLTGCAAGSTWSSNTCWANSSGGGSSNSVPVSTDTVIFDGGGTGACSINAAASALSITMQAGYTGTITHSAGNISLSGALTISGGTFSSTATSSTINISTNQSGSYVGDLVVSGGAFSSSGAKIAVRNISVSGSTSSVNTGASAISTNNSGTVRLSGGNVTFGTGGSTLAGTFTVNGATTTIGNATFTAPSAVTISSGTLSFGSGNVALNGGLTISGTGAVTLGTGTTQTATTVTVSSSASPALTFATGSTFTSTDVFSQSAGTVTANNATLTFGSAVAGGSDGFAMTGGTFNGGTSTLSVGITGKNGGQTTTINGTGATFDGTSGTQHFYGVLNVTSGIMTLGTADMVSSRNGGSANTDKVVSVGAAGTLNLKQSFAFPTTTAMTLAGAINAGSGTVKFTPAVTFIGAGSYDAQQSTTTFSAAVTMSSVSSTFSGGTGTTTFSVAPTFTAGVFNVGSNGTTGAVIFTAGATFAGGANGMTVAFPTSGGTLSAPGGQTIAINGIVTSSAGAIAARPRISRSSGTTGINVSFGATSTLNMNGLDFYNVVSTGVTIADGATYGTTLKNLRFQSNVANSTSSGATHLAITSSNTGGTKVIQIPGCYFDSTAQYNVTLSGVSGSTGVRAIFEYQSTTVNGPRGGPLYDLDADTNGDNVADSVTANRYGAVVEWVRASPLDTAGTAVGFPTAAFDWNTFQWYGVYVAYKDTTGAGTADVLWNRNSDGSPAYSFSIPQSSGDIVGTPTWDTINETTANVDANGNGNKLDTDVHVVYVPTSLGHIIKLVDSIAGGLARPAQGAWASDFTDTGVSTISSALGLDGTNLYFGGTGCTSAPCTPTTKVFAVQVAGGTFEAKLVKTVGSVSAVTTTPSIKTSGGSTYLFLGSTASASQAYIYRINTTSLTVDASYSGATTNINGAVVMINNRAYASSDGGKVYALDAMNVNPGGFTNLTGFPYTTVGSSAVKNGPWVDGATNYAYFGDDGGKVYAINAAGTALTGFPLTISSSIKMTSTPTYITGGGVIAIGASDGYLYFIDRNNGTTASVFKRYFVTASGSVSTVAYNSNSASPMYMVSSSDGKLTFVNASDVTDPTPGSQ